MVAISISLSLLHRFDTGTSKVEADSLCRRLGEELNDGTDCQLLVVNGMLNR
jgi:hypothetical protein